MGWSFEQWNSKTGALAQEKEDEGLLCCFVLFLLIKSFFPNTTIDKGTDHFHQSSKCAEDPEPIVLSNPTRICDLCGESFSQISGKDNEQDKNG
jgi:hypothetical protein